MVVYFKSARIQTIFNSANKLHRKYGKDQADKIMQRMAEIEAFDNLAQLREYPPARFHKLAAERNGQYAVDLHKAYRLILEPANDPLALLPDGSVDLSKVTEVYIVEIVDYH